MIIIRWQEAKRSERVGTAVSAVCCLMVPNRQSHVSDDDRYAVETIIDVF